MKEQEIYKQAIIKFGIDAQVDMITEEAAEIIQAISKMKRRGGGFSENFHEEFADLEIVMGQIKPLLNQNRLMFWKKYKLDRLEKRIETHEQSPLEC